MYSLELLRDHPACLSFDTVSRLNHLSHLWVGWSLLQVLWSCLGIFFFKIFFFNIDHLKVSFELNYNIVSFMFWGFGGLKACGILVPQQGLNSHPWIESWSPNPGILGSGLSSIWRGTGAEGGRSLVSQEWNRFDKEKGPSRGRLLKQLQNASLLGAWGPEVLKSFTKHRDGHRLGPVWASIAKADI